MTVVQDTLVEDYLGRLERAARVLPAQRRTELVDEVRAHIAEARGEGPDDEASVRSMLDRLGPPEEIVAAACEGPPVAAEPRLRTRDIATLLLLPFGGLVFVAGWFLGLILLWSSDRWRTWEKLLGTLVVPFGYLGTGYLWFFGGQSCLTDSSGRETCDGFALPAWLGLPASLVTIFGPALVAVLLTTRAAPGRSLTARTG